MGAAKKIIDKKVLRDLVPINALSAVHLDEISGKTVIEDIRAGAYVFRKGDRDYQTVYLLEGRVELLDAGRHVVDTLTAGTEQACHPLAHKQPRQVSARAVGKVTVARVDSSLLDVLLTWDESAGYDVVELDREMSSDWMTRMLQSEAFLQLPPSNIHQLLMRLEPVEAGIGDVIVRQGDEGDYFYIVQSGNLVVTRKASPRSKEVLLAELGEGACFGEEALVSGATRNASVMMVTDGSLMRLSKSDFDELLRTPLVHETDYTGAQELIARGACWLDVRLPGEFENQAIRGSVNLPLSALRERCTELDRNTPYIVCCDTGRRSAAGAFVLSQRGFTVYTLKNGLVEVPEEVMELSSGQSAAGDRDAEIIPFDNDARPEAASETRKATEDGGDSTADDALIDKLAAAEGDKLALQEEVTRLETRVAELDCQIEELQVDAGERREALEQELTAAREELENSRDALHSGQQRQDARLQSLEHELERLRDEHRQLGQRASALAGERDAAIRDLQEAQEQLQTSRERLAGDETEKQSLQQKLQEALQDRENALSAESAEADSRKQLEALEGDIRQLRQELASADEERQRLRQELENTGQGRREVDDTLETMARERDRIRQDLEAADAERNQLRQDLEEALRDRQQAGEELAAADEERRRTREELEAADAERRQLRENLESTDRDREQASQALDAADEERRRLREELEAAGEDRLQLQQALDSRLAEAQSVAASETAQLQNRVDELSRALEQAGEDAAAERKLLSDQVARLEQELQQRQEDHDRLENTLTAAGGEKEELTARIAGLQQALEEQRRQAQSQQTENEQLRLKIEDLQRNFEEKSASEQELQNRVQELRRQDESQTSEQRRKLDEAQARIAALESDLEAARQQQQAAERLNSEFAGRMESLVKEHKSDLDSTRSALSRAQSETENVKREHSRVSEALRKAEENLEHERQDHESELYRLRRELNEAAGGSDAVAGLTAELEALKTRLQEGNKSREELELQLGERSAQLRDTQAEADRLVLQLQQAQESARGAEQQLLESSRVVNEEMTVRMQAEEKARQELRAELAAVVSERNSVQEQLTVQSQELDELRQAVMAGRQDLARREQLEQERLEKLFGERDTALDGQRRSERERDEMREQLERTRQELDQVRAEAEVTRGLVDMQANNAGDAALREQLDQARQNVDVALRLRTQAEERYARLEEELEELRSHVRLAGAATAEVGKIPSLDADDPDASAAPGPVYGQGEDDDTGARDNRPAEARRAVLLSDPGEEKSSSGWTGVLGGLLLGAAAAGAGTWWLLNRQPVASVPDPAGRTVTEAVPPDTRVPEADVSGADSARKAQAAEPPVSDVPAADASPDPVDRHESTAPRSRGAQPGPARQSMHLPDFVKGGATTSGETRAPSPEEDNVGKQAGAEEMPPAGIEPPAPADKPVQPLRLYSEPLQAGGRAPTLVEFQADSFRMGSGPSSANFDERPRHTVSLPSFAIGAREVTFDDYDRFARDSGRPLPADKGWGRGNRPVINVSWRDAVAYTRWLSEQTGGRYRLPSEAEWEFAARAGAESLFWWGNEVGSGQANCFDCDSEWSGSRTAPAGSFAASPYRVHDMAGNVMEWVQDCYLPDYSSAPADGSAVAAGDCSRRVVRGGAYNSPSESLRSASRGKREAGARLDNLGFRVVKE